MIAPFLYFAALRDLSRPKRIFTWMAVLVLLFGIGKLLLFASGGQTAAGVYDLTSSLISMRVLALASAVFSASVIAQEIEQKTITYLLTRPIDRRVLLVSRALAASTFAFFIGALAVITTSLSVLGPAGLQHAPMWRDVLACAFGAVAYTALFVVVSLLVAKGAMLISLLFAFGWETITSSVPGDIYRLSIATYLNGISQRAPSGDEATASSSVLSNLVGPKPIEPGTSMLVLAVLSVVCLVGGAFWFRSFEYTPREDAD